MIKKYRGGIIVFYLFAIISMVVASFMDLKIDHMLYNPENPVSIWFWCTGEMPARLVCPLAGLVIILCAKKKISRLIGYAIELGGSAYLGYHIADYFFTKDDNQTIFGITYGIGFGIFLLFIGRYIKVPDKIKKPLLTIAIAGIAVMFCETVMVEGIKIVWGRVRYRELLATKSFESFVPWYKPQGITNSNEFKSFPSGHTAGAGVSYLAMLLPYSSTKWEKKKALCFIIPFIYTSVVAFTRMMMGAHFLSDVTVGATISFTAVVIAMAILDKRNK